MSHLINYIRHYPLASLCLTGLFMLSMSVSAQDAYEDSTVISPMSSSNTIMVNMSGTTIKTWHGAAAPAFVAYLMSDDSIIRPCQDLSGYFHGGGVGGRIQRISSSDVVVWDYYCSTSTYQQHHDIQPMPNGNILMSCWETKSRTEAQAIGRVSITSSMWPTMIQEIQPSGSSGGIIVWEWHMWDHLIQDVDASKPNYGVVADHPELLDINVGALAGGGGDWEHINAIDYNPILDQIVISSHNLHEIYIIDHSTTTAEAAGHTGGNCGKGGDLLYRWGNPQNYDRGTTTDRYLYVVHGVNWIDEGLPGAGNLLLLNNGDRSGSSNDYSSAEEIVPPLLPDGNYAIAAGAAFGPASPVWSYSDPGTFYAAHLGGCYRLPNGNTIITEGTTGYIFEVSSTGTVEWDYDISGELARVERYWTATTPTATFTPTPTQTPTLTPAPTNTPTNTPTRTPTQTPTPGIPTNTPTGPTPTPGCENDGDVTQDGSLTAADAQTAFLVVLGSYSPTSEQYCSADCNGDELVTAADAQLIFLSVLGTGSCAEPIRD